MAVLVRDPSATTPVDVSLKHNRRAHYLSQPASESHPTPPPRLRRPYRSLGCEVVGTGAVVGEVGIGNGLMMTTDFGFGGPCPPPSCATVTVAADDAMTRKVTIAYFILTLLRAQVGAAMATSVRDPQRTSPADASNNAPHRVTVPADRGISLPS